MQIGEEGEPAVREASEVESLADHYDEVARRLGRAGRLALLLDFDGTLAPIVERPELARIPDSTRATLDRLTRRPDTWVAILSGRALADVRERVGLDGLTYAGNHGLEIAGPGGVSFEEPSARDLRSRLATLTDSLRDRLGGVASCEVEAKGLTTSVHYRRVAQAAWEHVAREVGAAVPADDPAFEVREGKRVIEIRPKGTWGKGQAALWLLQNLGRPGDLPLFLGDDITDEDAFRALRDRGITARVEPFPTTAARFLLPNTLAVARLLDWLAARPIASD